MNSAERWLRSENQVERRANARDSFELTLSAVKNAFLKREPLSQEYFPYGPQY